MVENFDQHGEAVTPRAKNPLNIAGSFHFSLGTRVALKEVREKK
jgi:hypothetical protein